MAHALSCLQDSLKFTHSNFLPFLPRWRVEISEGDMVMETFISDADQAVIHAREAKKPFKIDDAKAFIINQLRFQFQINPTAIGILWDKVRSLIFQWKIFLCTRRNNLL